MTPARARNLLLLGTALAALALVLAWSQPWFTFVLAEGDVLPIGGDVAAAALMPLALSTLALVAALAIAGTVFRIVLGVLEALLGACVVAVAVVALGDPITAGASAVTAATGITGSDSIAELVASMTTSAWPSVAIAVGAVIGALGVLVALSAPHWPTGGRKYTRTRTVAADPESADTIAEWDALSDGDDPTEQSR